MVAQNWSYLLPTFHMMTKPERHESQHEYNFFLDREIQNQLLAVEEEEEENEIQKLCIGIISSSNVQISGTSSANAKLAKGKSFDEFTAWCPDPYMKLRKPDKSIRSLKDRDFPKWDNWSSKDFRPKEINFVFKHHAERRKFIEQYRKEHTYNFGPLGNKDIEIPKIHPHPEHIMRHQQSLQRLPLSTDTTYNSAKPTTRTNSESNLLDLVNRNKISSNNGKPSSGPTQNEWMRMRPQISTSRSESDSFSTKLDSNGTRTKSESAKPQLTSLGKACTPVNTGGSGLSLVHTKVPAINSSSNPIVQGKKVTPPPPPNSQSGTPPQSLTGKTMKQTPSNGFAIDSQSLTKATSNKSPTILLPNTQLRTMDLLSQVSAVDRQEGDHVDNPPTFTKKRMSTLERLQLISLNLMSGQYSHEQEDKARKLTPIKGEEQSLLYPSPRIQQADFQVSDVPGRVQPINSPSLNFNDYLQTKGKLDLEQNTRPYTGRQDHELRHLLVHSSKSSKASRHDIFSHSAASNLRKDSRFYNSRQLPALHSKGRPENMSYSASEKILMMEVESYGWREKLRALREKPKPQTPSTARKSRVAYLPSAHQRLSHSPSLGDLSSILRKRDQSSAKQSRSTDFSTHSCKNSLNDGCPYPSEYYLGKHMMHQIGGVVSHDTQNTLTCPTVSDRRVPECLDTSSDFFNPGVSAEERFEKYLNEMHRREHQIELFEKRKLATTTIGHPKVSVTGRDNFDKIKIERSRYKGMAGSHPMRILPDIKRSSSLDSDPQTKPLNTTRTKLADGELLTVKTLLTQPDVETATKPKEIKYKLFYTTR